MNNRTEEISHPLDLNERFDLHRKGWRVQPVGKALILALMVAGLLGLFGEGWLSSQTVRSGNTQVQYERFFRQDGEMDLDVAAAGVAGKSAILLPLTYLQHMQIIRISPKPERSFTRDGQVWYVFEADQNLQANFRMRPKTRGKVSGNLWVNETQIPIHHFIFP